MNKQLIIIIKQYIPLNRVKSRKTYVLEWGKAVPLNQFLNTYTYSQQTNPAQQSGNDTQPKILFMNGKNTQNGLICIKFNFSSFSIHFTEKIVKMSKRSIDQQMESRTLFLAG